MCLIQVKCPVTAFSFNLSFGDDDDDGLQIDIFIFCIYRKLTGGYQLTHMDKENMAMKRKGRPYFRICERSHYTFRLFPLLCSHYCHTSL